MTQLTRGKVLALYSIVCVLLVTSIVLNWQVILSQRQVRTFVEEMRSTHEAQHRKLDKQYDEVSKLKEKLSSCEFSGYTNEQN